jgi:acyl dehydratase
MFLEDFRPGDRADLGTHSFTEAEIIAFAQQFDPQPFHVDPEAAGLSPYGGLIASGWHTCVVWMRLMIVHLQALDARGGRDGTGHFGPSPGIRDLRWARPVRPGDTLRFATEVTEVRASLSRPGWGLVSNRNSAVNQDGEEVLSFSSTAFVERRRG